MRRRSSGGRWKSMRMIRGRWNCSDKRKVRRGVVRGRIKDSGRSSMTEPLNASPDKQDQDGPWKKLAHVEGTRGDQQMNDAGRTDEIESQRSCGDEPVGSDSSAKHRIDEHSSAADVHHPSSEQQLKNPDPAGGFGAAQHGAKKMKRDHRQPEHAGLGEAILVFAQALGGRALEHA